MWTGQQRSSCVPLVDERVEAGEDEKRHHSTESHHIAELRLQDIAAVSLHGNIQCTITANIGLVLQPLYEILQGRAKNDQL